MHARMQSGWMVVSAGLIVVAGAMGAISGMRPDAHTPQPGQPAASSVQPPPADAPDVARPPSQPVPAVDFFSPEELIWAQGGVPGIEHRRLDPLIGEFVAEAKFWAAPEAPPTELTGEVVNTWVLDGRYVRSEFKASWNEGVFQGLGYWAYDRGKKKYVELWMDSISTRVIVREGDADLPSRTITFTGTFVDPLGKPVHERNVLRILGDDAYAYEMTQWYDGQEPTRVGEIVYRRKPRPARSDGGPAPVPDGTPAQPPDNR